MEKILYKVIFKNHNNVIVEYSDIEAMNYDELDEQANKIAQKLLEDFKSITWEASTVVRTGLVDKTM